MSEVREALRRALESRGLGVADDTVATSGAIYVKGDGDSASGLFDFKNTVREAIDALYQGHWIEGLPPRFVVLPAECASDPSFELLEQMRIIPLLYKTAEGDVTFLELDAALERLVR